MGIFAGKTAFITGSSRGIGRAAADLLASRGSRVIYHGRTMNDSLIAAAQTAGNRSIPLAGDLGDSREAEALVQNLLDREIFPDIIVLNASSQYYANYDNCGEDEFSDMIRTNISASCYLLRHFLPCMRRKGGGRVIFVGSINGIKPAGRLAVYGATKAAMMNIAKSAAMENAQYNITVNTILPGVIETDRNKAALEDKDFAEQLKNQIPMHRFGLPWECAELIAFLASDKAAYITGAEIPVAGGWQL